jgi:hypothetical protein
MMNHMSVDAEEEMVLKLVFSYCWLYVLPSVRIATATGMVLESQGISHCYEREISQGFIMGKKIYNMSKGLTFLNCYFYKFIRLSDLHSWDVRTHKVTIRMVVARGDGQYGLNHGWGLGIYAKYNLTMDWANGTVKKNPVCNSGPP